MTEMRCFQINVSFWKGQLSDHNLFYKMILHCITQVCRAFHVQSISCYTPTFTKRRNQAGTAGKWMKIYLNYQQLKVYITIKSTRFLVKTKHKHKDAPILSSSPAVRVPQARSTKSHWRTGGKTHEEVVRKTSRKKHAIRYRFGCFRKV